MSTFGVKSVSIGSHAILETDVKKITFSTQYEMLKVKLEGIKQVTASGTLTFDHDLKYAPVFLFFIKGPLLGGTQYRKILCTSNYSTVLLRSYATTALVSINDREGTGTRELFYNVLEDPISLY